MTKGFTVVLLAAGLAGCGATPVEHRNYREIDPSDGMFADTATSEWRRKDKIATASPVSAVAPLSAAEQGEFKKWQGSADSAERREFEEWRAWQEWKRKNPK